VVAVLVFATGCRAGADDEMVPPTRTITASPSPPTVTAPTRVPVGHGKVSTSSVVWAQENTLHVGARRFDLSPRRVDSFVVVRGGVFFVDRGTVWFTDLARVRDTGLRSVTRLTTTRDHSAMRVEMSAGSGPSSVHAYDVLDGASTSPGNATPATTADRLGTSVQVTLAPERSDLNPVTPAPAVQARLGPGHFGIVGGDGEPLIAFVSATKVRVPLAGVVGDGFELVRWTSGSTLFGLARAGAKPLATISCDLRARRCTTLGRVVAGRLLVFESGT